MGLISFVIKNFRGIVALSANPDGRSVTLRGANGAGKSAAIDALWWGLGGGLDEEVVRNGAKRAEVEILIDNYRVTRKVTRGGRPTLTVTPAGGGQPERSPTELLRGFAGALSRRSFSALDGKRQQDTLRQLAPGLDTSAMDAERSTHYAARTAIGRVADSLQGQLDGVVIPEEVPDPGTERPIGDVVDVAALAESKAEAVAQRARNDAERARVKTLQAGLAAAERAIDAANATCATARRALAEAEERAKRADREWDAARLAALDAEKKAAALADPDTTAIDREIADARRRNAEARQEAEQHNRAVRAALQARRDRAVALRGRDDLAARLAAEKAKYRACTEAIEALDERKARQLAAARLPIDGISLGPDGVMFDDGMAGPVEIGALNTATRIRLDVAIAAALGHRLVAIRDASLLDGDQRHAIERLADRHGVQLFFEIVSDGGPLQAVIAEAPSEDQPAADPAAAPAEEGDDW